MKCILQTGFGLVGEDWYKIFLTIHGKNAAPCPHTVEIQKSKQFKCASHHTKWQKRVAIYPSRKSRYKCTCILPQLK